MLSMQAKSFNRNPSRRQRFSRTALSIAVLSCFTGNTIANPTGANVVAGQATLQQVAGKLVIQNTPNTIINWQQFNIGHGEVTQFIQQNANSSVLNRVVGGDLSQILGTLQSNGRVFLINPNGILFGQGARIDVAGLVASTLNITNQDFLSGKLNFAAQGADAFIKNQGEIVAGKGGQIVLVSPNIENSGIIHAPNGDVLLAAGRSVTVVDIQKPAISIDVQAPATQAVNLGSIIAGRVSVYGQLVRHEGLTEATGAVAGEGGKIRLVGTKSVELTSTSVVKANGDVGGQITVQAEQGTALVAGTVQAQGTSGVGGSIDLLGQQVGVLAGANLSADGVAGGGQVHIGGGWQGKDATLQNANNTYVDATAKVSANALANGNGGEVVIWSEQSSQVYGQLQAKGGALGGDGGRIETSSHGVLALNSVPDTSAPLGKAGELLLDPQDIEIVDARLAPAPQPEPSSIFRPSTNTTRISADVIVDSLVRNSTVVLTTVGSQASPTDGAQPTGSITVNAPIVIPAGTNSPAGSPPPFGTYNLGFIAEGAITINSPIGLADTTNNILNLDLQFSKTGGGQLNAPLALGGGALSFRHSTPSGTQAPSLTPAPLPVGFSINPNVNISNNGLQTLSLATLVGVGGNSEVAPPLFINGADVKAKNFSSFGEVFVRSVDFGEGGILNSRVAITDNASLGRLVIAPNNTVELGASSTAPVNGSFFNFAGLGTAAPTIVNGGSLVLRANNNQTQAFAVSQSGIVVESTGSIDIGAGSFLLSQGVRSNPALKVDAGGSVNIAGSAILSNSNFDGLALDSAGAVTVLSEGQLTTSGNVALRTGSFTQVESSGFAAFSDDISESPQPTTFTLDGGATLNVDGTALLAQNNDLLYGNLNVSGSVQIGSIFANALPSSPASPSSVDFGFGNVNVNSNGSINLGNSNVHLNNSTININQGGVLNAETISSLSFDFATINLNGNSIDPTLQTSNPESPTGGQLFISSLSGTRVNPGSTLNVNAFNYDNFIGNFSDNPEQSAFEIGSGVRLNVNGPAFSSQSSNSRTPTLTVRSQSIPLDFIDSDLSLSTPSESPILSPSALRLNGFSNFGDIQVNTGTFSVDASSYGNFGGIRIGAEGNFALAAPIKTSDVLAINRDAGSNLTLSKTLDNTNAVLDLGATGNIRVRDNLKISGGSVVSSREASLNVMDDSFVKFDSVNLGAEVNIGNASGVQLSNGTQLNNATLNFDRGYGLLAVDGTPGQTAVLAGSATINATTPGNFILASNGATTLEIGQNINIQAAGGNGGALIPDGIFSSELSPSTTTLTLGKVTQPLVSVYENSASTGTTSDLPFPVPSTVTLDGIPGLDSLFSSPGTGRFVEPITFATSQNLVNKGSINVFNNGSVSIGGTALVNETTGTIATAGGSLAIDTGVSSITNRGFMQLGQNLLNSGSFTNENTGILEILRPITILPTLSNFGTLTFFGGNSTTTFLQPFFNAGDVTFKSGNYRFNNSYQQSEGLTSLERGSIIDCSGGENGMAIFGGTLRGLGTINGFVEIGNGDLPAFLAPGFSPGALTFNGNLVLSPNSTTQIELGGTQAGVTYDAINVSGSATLGGVLSLSSINGFVPQPTDNFNVLSYNNVSGQFGSQVFNQPLQSANLVFGPNGTSLNNAVVSTAPVPTNPPAPLPTVAPSQFTPPPAPAPVPVVFVPEQPTVVPVPRAEATAQVNDTVLAQTVRPTATPVRVTDQQTELGAEQPTSPVVAAATSSGPVNNIRLEPRQTLQRAAATCR